MQQVLSLIHISYMLRIESHRIESSLMLLSAEVRFTFSSDKTLLMVIFPVAFVSFSRGFVSLCEMKKQINIVSMIETPPMRKTILR